MELDEFHVLQGQPGAQHHGVAVAGADVRRRTGKVGASIAAGCQDNHLAAKTVQAAFVKIDGDDAAANAVFHDQVHGEEFDKELGVVLQGLLIEGVQHGMPRSVGCRAGTLRDAFAIVGRHPAERALIDASVFGAGKGHAVVFQFDDRRGRLLAHVFDGVLVAQPVRPLDRVVHVPAPVVRPHVAQRGADSTLRGDGMAAGGKDLGNARSGKPLLGQPHGGAQPGAARADDDYVAAVFDEFVFAGHAATPNATFSTAKMPATATAICAKNAATRENTLTAGVCT